MARISASVEVPAPASRVWRIISDLDAEPRFWKGTKSVRNVHGEGNKRIREVTLAFGQKCMQEVYLEPPRVRSVFTAGALEGTKLLQVEGRGDGSVLRAEWDVRPAGAASALGGLMDGRIRTGTERALEAIREAAS